jgi:hypothetical protein
MTRRRLLYLCLTLLLVALLVLPAVHWRVIGWVNGEAFYQGRPTSWWARELQRIDWLSLLSSQAPPDPKPAWVPEVARPLWDDPMLGVGLLDPHPPHEAVPVLLGLLQHDDDKVRRVAAEVLRQIDPEEAAQVDRE